MHNFTKLQKGSRQQPGTTSTDHQTAGTFNAPNFVETTGEIHQPRDLGADLFQCVDHDREIELVAPIPHAGSKLDPEKAFILGPGRAPIPAKLVTQITSHKFIDLSEIIPENMGDPSLDITSFTIEDKVQQLFRSPPLESALKTPTFLRGWNVLIVTSRSCQRIILIAHATSSPTWLLSFVQPNVFGERHG